MEISKCKGCRDLNEEEMLRFRQVEDTFRRVSRGWGYREVRTPTLEYLYLFTAAGTLTPGMLHRVYSFLDWDGWSGERVVLKPDATIPAARLFLEQLSRNKFARLCYVTNTFVFEETGTKPRERWQCGAELIGPAAPLADAELVALAVDVLRQLGLKDISVKLSHAGLIRELLSEAGLSKDEQSRIFDELLDGRVPDTEQMKVKPEIAGALGLLFNQKGKSPGFIKNVRALTGSRMPGLQATLDSFASVLELVDQLGVRYEIDLSVGKGFEYYTGLIFRLYSAGENIGGGGRYDQLIGAMGGKPTPAGGFALYMDRLMAECATPAETTATRVGLLMDDDQLKQGMELADKLRQAGFIVELSNEKTELPDFDFAVGLNRAGEAFSVTDCLTASTSDCNSLDDLLSLLGAG